MMRLSEKLMQGNEDDLDRVEMKYWLGEDTEGEDTCTDGSNEDSGSDDDAYYDDEADYE